MIFPTIKKRLRSEFEVCVFAVGEMNTGSNTKASVYRHAVDTKVTMTVSLVCHIF